MWGVWVKVNPVNGEDIVCGIGAMYYRRISGNGEIGLVLDRDVDYHWLLLLLKVVVWQNRSLTSSEN